MQLQQFCIFIFSLNEENKQEQNRRFAVYGSGLSTALKRKEKEFANDCELPKLEMSPGVPALQSTCIG